MLALEPTVFDDTFTLQLGSPGTGKTDLKVSITLQDLDQQ